MDESTKKRIDKMCEDGKKRLVITQPRKKIYRGEEPYMKTVIQFHRKTMRGPV
jgi:hypothetical protein